MHLDDFFDRLYRPQRLFGKSVNTTRLYHVAIRNLGKSIGHRPTLDDLTDTTITSHMQTLLDRGRAPATANKDRGHLVAMWRHAHRLGLINRYPNVPTLTEPTRTPQAWLPGDLAKLMNTIDDQEGHFGSVPRSLWWRTLIMVCLETGERIGAIRQAKWNWLQGEWLTVPAEARKGGKRDRAYRLGSGTVGHLAAIRMVSPVSPFPWEYCSVYLWTLFGELLRAAGLPSDRRHKFHMLRRTTASVVHQAGMDAQEALDHSYKRTTQLYLDPRFTSDRQPCDVLETFLAQPRQKQEKKRKAE